MQKFLVSKKLRIILAMVLTIVLVVAIGAPVTARADEASEGGNAGQLSELLKRAASAGEPTLKDKVTFQHLGAGEDGTQKYKLEATVEFPGGQPAGEEELANAGEVAGESAGGDADNGDGSSTEVDAGEATESPATVPARPATPYEADEISFVAKNPLAEGGEGVRIDKVDEPKIDGRELDEDQVTWLEYADRVLDEQGNEVKMPDDVSGDLITFDSSETVLTGSMTFSATVYVDGELKSTPEWTLYSGDASAYKLASIPAATLTPRSARAAAPENNIPTQYWINTGKNDPRIYRMVIGDKFPGSDATYHIDREIKTDIAYGDIAITRDASRLYAISFNNIPAWWQGGHKRWYLDTYDPNTGERLHREYVGFPNQDTDGFAVPNELNSLSVDYDGNLLVSTAKSNNIWKIDIPRCSLESENWCSTHEENGIHKVNMKFPSGYTASGDFVVSPDGGLYGFGTRDSEYSARNAHLFYWPPNVPNDPSKGRKSEAQDLGELSGSAYGGGRIDDSIITVDGRTNFIGTGRGIAINTIQGDPNRVLIARGDTTSGKVTSEPDIQWPPSKGAGLRGQYWGATSTGESGPTPNERYIQVEKELPRGRVDGAHQFKLHGHRESSASTMYKPVVTTGDKNGLQKEFFRGIGRVGTDYVVTEQLVNKDGNKIEPGSGGNNKSTRLSDYDTTLQCVAGSRFDANAPKLVNARVGDSSDSYTQVEYDAKNNTRSTRFKIPKTSEETITCRFVNSFVRAEKYPRADREPADPIQVDGKNQAELTYQVEVQNRTTRTKDTGKVIDKIRFPNNVVAAGDATIKGAVFAANADKPKDDNSAIKNLRSSWKQDQIKTEAELPLADNVQLKPEERARFSITVRVQVADNLNDEDWKALGVCTYESSQYRSGGVPNQVNLDGDADGTDNNVACIPLLRNVPVGFQLYKASKEDNDSYTQLDGAEFALHEYTTDEDGKKSLGQVVATFNANPADKTSAEGLSLNQEYGLVETKASDGYSLLPLPICFRLVRNTEKQIVAELCDEDKEIFKDTVYPKKLTDGSNPPVYLDKDTAIISVVNSKNVNLPRTGGSGVYLTIFLGLLIITAGAAASTMRRSA